MTRAAVLLLSATLTLGAQFAMRKAPGFSLPDQKQKQHDLTDYRGKVVVIEFMRTDCPRCQAVTQVLEQAKPKYGDRLQVLSVVTMPDNVGTVNKYVAAYKVTSPVLFDCGQMMASYLNITPQNPAIHMPHVFILDRAGMIRRDFGGEAATGPNILGAIEAALK